MATNSRWTVLLVIAVAIVLIGKAQSTLFDRARAHVTGLDGAGVRSGPPAVRLGLWGGWHNISESYGVYEENVRLKEENARLRQWQTAAVMLQSQVKLLPAVAACGAGSRALFRAGPWMNGRAKTAVPR